MIEILGIAVASALALYPIGQWLHRAGATRAAAMVALGWAFVIAAAIAIGPPKAEPEALNRSRPIEVSDDEYVGSDTCRSCHPDQYSSWEASYHRSMTQVPGPETVLAPWQGVRLRFRHSYQLEQRGDEYWALSDNPAWQKGGRFPLGERRIVLITGSHHEQFFWYATDHDRQLALLPVVYRIAEKRWLPHKGVLLTPEVTGAEDTGRWNTGCIVCHSTKGQPRVELINDSKLGHMDTQAAEFGIACEACHGPAGEHVRANRSPVRRYLGHFSEGGDPSIVNPARLSPKRSTEVCGSCHSVFLFEPKDMRRLIAEGHGFEPGDKLDDSRWVVSYSDRSDPRMKEIGGEGMDGFAHRFWPDGMPSTNGREMSGLRESKCFQESDMTCLSCHKMHKSADDPRSLREWADDQLAPEMNSDAACVDCHPQLGEALREHTHHPAESAGSRCYNCHMPNTAYGLLKQTRSHLIDSPSVANTLETKRPNACNLCHLDKTLAWTADQLEDWYGIPKPELGEADQHFTSDAVVRALSGDAGLRAMVAWHMGWQPALEASGSDWMVPVLAQLLEDPYMAVRFLAGRSLRSRPGWENFPYMYLSSATELVAAKERALTHWSDLDAVAERTGREAVLIGNDGRVLEARFQRLLRKRDDSIVYRQE